MKIFLILQTCAGCTDRLAGSPGLGVAGTALAEAPLAVGVTGAPVLTLVPEGCSVAGAADSALQWLIVVLNSVELLSKET